MKSNFLLFILLAILSIKLSAQPLHWTESLYDPLKKSTIIKENAIKTEGMSSLKYIFTDDGTPYFICDTFNVTAGTTYNFSIDYLDNDPAGAISARIWFYSAPGTAYLERKTTTVTVDSPNWQTITYTGTTPATATIAYIAIRMSSVAAAWTGSAMFYADNLIYTQNGGTTNLVLNPGFEDWAPPVILPGSTVVNWTESLFDPTKTSIIVNEPTIKTEGFNSLKYTFTDNGTPYFICDTFNVTAGTTYNFSIDYLDNDPAGAISARIWFYSAPGTAYLERKTTAATVDSPNWQTITYTGTTPATATIAYIAIRMSAVTASWAGSATFYADNTKYTENSGTTDLIKNPGFEDWLAPTGAPELLTYKFEGLTPNVVGVINNTAHTVALTVPYATDVTSLVATFTLTENSTAKVGATNQVSGTTSNDFTNPVIYTLSSADGTLIQDWEVTVTKIAPATDKDIIGFKFAGLTPAVNGIVVPGSKTVSLEVPAGTDVTALVPTITISAYATVSPSSGVAQNFTAPVTYTVTAQDGSNQAWIVTVTFAAAGQTTLFFEDFESIQLIPTTWKIINNDGYIQAVGEERWQDSAWVVTTSNRTELQGTKVAMASSYCSNMPLNGKADDWMILPSIPLGNNSTLSWQAMSVTSSGNYPDDYMVLVAPAIAGVAPTIPYFEENAIIAANITPEKWSANVSNPGQGLSSRSINLKEKGFANKNVWIAFVLTTDLTPGNSTAGGSNLAVDNIKVVDGTTGIDEFALNSLEATVFPNPATDKVVVSFNLSANAKVNIRIVDLTGREVLNLSENAVNGSNKFKVDVSGFTKGMYVMQTTVNTKLNVTKLILK
ncbi:MAG: T9SS type A sorting domain-containing protein [Bacteroidales bacterium]